MNYKLKVFKLDNKGRRTPFGEFRSQDPLELKGIAEQLETTKVGVEMLVRVSWHVGYIPVYAVNDIGKDFASAAEQLRKSLGIV